MLPWLSSFRWFLITLAAALAAFAVPSDAVRAVACCVGVMLLPALFALSQVDFLSEHNRRLAAGIAPSPGTRLALVPARLIVGAFALLTLGIGAAMVACLLYYSYQEGASFFAAAFLGLYATSRLFLGGTALSYGSHVLKVAFSGRSASFEQEGASWMPTPASVNWLCRTWDCLDLDEARMALPEGAQFVRHGRLWSVEFELGGTPLELQVCGGRRGPHAAAVRLAAELPQRWPEIAPKVLREALAVRSAFAEEDSLDEAGCEAPEPERVLHGESAPAPLVLRRILVCAGERHPDAVALTIQFSFEAPQAGDATDAFEAETVDVFLSEWLVCSYLPIRVA